MFGYPFTRTYSSQKIYFFALPNIFVFVFLVIAMGIAFYRYKSVPPKIFFLLLFMLIYLGGSSLLSAYRRMFYITMPYWTVFIGYVFGEIIPFEENGLSATNKGTASCDEKSGRLVPNHRKAT